MTPPKNWNQDLVHKVSERFRRADQLKRESRAKRYAEALRQLDRATEIVRTFPSARRLLTWGSVLKPHQFTETSDLDLCVEGIASPEEWNQLERALFEAVEFPLDLVRWEELIEPHRQSILRRGRVLYEST